MAGREQLVAVVVFVVKGERLLALRRASHKPAAGLWEGVSGRVERGEDPHDAAAREVREETGLTVEVDARPVDAYAMLRADAPMVVIAYRARWVAHEVSRSEEHDAERWVTLDEYAALCNAPRLVTVARRALAAAGGRPQNQSR